MWRFSHADLDRVRGHCKSLGEGERQETKGEERCMCVCRGVWRSDACVCRGGQDTATTAKDVNGMMKKRDFVFKKSVTSFISILTFIPWLNFLGKKLLSLHIYKQFLQA